MGLDMCLTGELYINDYGEPKYEVQVTPGDVISMEAEPSKGYTEMDGLFYE